MTSRPPPPEPGVRSYDTSHPSRRSTSLMIATSRMSGTSSSVVRPDASSAAAISLRALFLAPVTRTRPASVAPPVTSKHSTRSPYGAACHRTVHRPGGRRLRSAAMTVRLTRIYTKTGDAGQTHLGDMTRVAKTDPRLVAYADVDETNSVLGTALALGPPGPAVAGLLRSIQNDLFDVGADLCTPITPDPQYPPLRVTAVYTERLEAACDEYNAALPKLESFILP